MDNTPTRLCHYPEEARQTIRSCAAGAVRKTGDETSALEWLEDQLDLAIAGWMAEQRDELLETRAELATRHYHAMHYVLFFTVGRTMHAKASRIGEKTRLEVEGFLDELKDMGNETGDWAGTYTMLATWLVPFLD